MANEEGEEGTVREFGMDMYTPAIFKMDSQQVEHRELCSGLCGSLDGQGAWGRADSWTCVA